MSIIKDSDATKRRILDAATVEFAAHGLAGARVDRIAERAVANKSLIYAYFGNKDDLFDRVIEVAFEHFVNAVPFTPEDITGYAVSLFDYLVDHPDHLRVDAWRRLERPTATPYEVDVYAEKVDALAAVRPRYGVNNRFKPADVLTIVIALASAWIHAPDALAPHTTEKRGLQRDLVAGAISVLNRSQETTGSPELD